MQERVYNSSLFGLDWEDELTVTARSQERLVSLSRLTIQTLKESQRPCSSVCLLHVLTARL